MPSGLGVWGAVQSGGPRPMRESERLRVTHRFGDDCVKFARPVRRVGLGQKLCPNPYM